MPAALLSTLTIGAIALAGVMAPPPAEARHAEPLHRSSAHKVSISASRNVEESGRYQVTIKVASPRQATRIRVFQRQVDVLGDTSWNLTRTLAVNGVVTHKLKLAPIESNVERTRVTVSYREAPKTVSDSASTTVWSWTSLTKFRPYYDTDGTSPYVSYAINGTEFAAGWMTYLTEPSWESRHTLGHHCKAFSGTLGLADDSADGSSATFTISDGTHTLYSSPTLTPGMDKPVHFTFSRIYRIWIHADNTSPDAESTDDTATYPAIGDPEVLCTGVS
jgi:hypothetical protein